MGTKRCDNKSVGILVWEDSKLLLIERKKYNFGFAIPAGHQDGDTPEETAQKELSEEVGLHTRTLKKKLTKRLHNPCSRVGGTFHDWIIFEATNWSGEIMLSSDETKSSLWATKKEVRDMAQHLKKFASEQNIPLEKKLLPQLVSTTNQQSSWKQNPGLEPPMYFLFKEIGIV
ncbi:hypothetical protein CL630_00905 [bacterium]|nr:hypothetical protein [bacterium]|tara:strand:- start:16711 stop:17229 length:519 start_codon:yes stop_codon:yes gene_type:complete